MPGVLVDDQSFAIDPPPPFPSSCGANPPYHTLHSPFLYARSSVSKFAPYLTRSFSANSSRDREFSPVLLSQLSPRSYHFPANEGCTESLNILGNPQLDPRNSSLEAAFPTCDVQEFQLNAPMVEFVGNGEHFAPNVDDVGCFGSFADNIFPGTDAAVTMVGNGSDMEDQGAPGSPFSPGASIWSHSSTGGSLVGSPTRSDAILALHRFLPSNLEDEESLSAMDVYSCDEFRMYEFKVRRCMRGRSHDWTECPFAHPGEKARRRDPRRFHYSGTACPDFRKGNCKRGDACEYAHGVFECWLHPARYRTQPCKDGRNCKRRVCFFAHTSEQLRLLPAVSGRTLKSCFTQKLSQCESYDGSPLRSVLAASVDATIPPIEQGGAATCGFDGVSSWSRNGTTLYGYLGENLQVSSPVSTPVSPPSSPTRSPPLSVDWPNASLRSPFAVPTNPHSIPQASATGTGSPTQANIPQARSLHNQTSIPPHRRHLDRLNSVPTISIPTSDPIPASLSSPSSPASMYSARHISDLIASLKQLDVSGSEPVWQAGHVANTVGAARYSLGPSPLRGNSFSVPTTPTKLWQNRESHSWRFDDREPEPVMERVESGRDLRAKIFENLVKRNQQEIDVPDVGWVSDLVKEESNE